MPKTRIYEKTSSIRLVVSIHYRLVTDGQTNGQTHDDSIASRGKRRGIPQEVIPCSMEAR